MRGTEFLDLKKPSIDDKVDINVINRNMDTIDKRIKEDYDILTFTKGKVNEQEDNLGELSNRVTGQGDALEEQSKSNLVLVTTMQKLLSEKIEELEREKERADYFGRNLVTVWNDTSKKGTAYTSLGYMEDIKSEEEGIVFVKMRADIASWTDKKLRIVTGPTKYFDITKDGEHVFETVLAPSSTQYLLYSGMQKADSEKNIVEWEQISVIRKSEYKGMFVFTRPYSLILEELDFYKSQLEKLKLTQEVDLNLLLTL